MARYADKVVIVTGGSKGIGRGIVTAFVEGGAKVVFCARGSAAGEALEAELNPKGPGCCKFVSCDMSKEDDIQRLVSFTAERFGHIDCLVNNAGWHPPHKPTDHTSAQEFRDLLDLNLVSYFLASKFALPYLRQRQGNIINVSSLVGSIGQKDAVPYVATKGAIISMTKAMAVDESRYRVRVNCLSPGNVMTPLWEELASQSPDAEAAIRDGQNSQVSLSHPLRVSLSLSTWALKSPSRTLESLVGALSGTRDSEKAWSALLFGPKAESAGTLHTFTGLLGRMGSEAECGAAAMFLAADATFCTGIDLLLSGGAELNYGFKNQCPVPT